MLTVWIWPFSKKLLKCGILVALFLWSYKSYKYDLCSMRWYRVSFCSFLIQNRPRGIFGCWYMFGIIQILFFFLHNFDDIVSQIFWRISSSTSNRNSCQIFFTSQGKKQQICFISILLIQICCGLSKIFVEFDKAISCFDQPISITTFVLDKNFTHIFLQALQRF